MCKTGKEADVPAEPPDSPQQQQPAGEEAAGDPKRIGRNGVTRAVEHLIPSLLRADGAPLRPFVARHNATVQGRRGLWVLLRGADTDNGSQPLQTRSSHLLGIRYRYPPNLHIFRGINK